jgi:2-oxoglutarate dehydrogenase E2 component (dihydrolipoamide succinyltransferase)
LFRPGSSSLIALYPSYETLSFVTLFYYSYAARITFRGNNTPRILPDALLSTVSVFGSFLSVFSFNMASRLPLQTLRAVPRVASRNLTAGSRRTLTSASLRKAIKTPGKAALGLQQIPVLGSNISRSGLARLGGYQVRTYADTVVKVPQMAESITEGTLKQFTKQVGDYVERDEELATIETDKIDVSVNAPEAGVIKELLVNEEDTVTVGQDLAKIEPGGAPEAKEEASEKPKEPAAAEQPKAPEPEQPKPEAPKPPAAEKPKAPEPPKQSQPAASTPSEAKPTPGSRGEQRVKMNRMRLRIAERLKQSQNTAASLTTFNEVDMSSLMEFRKLYKDEVLKKSGVKLGFMSAFSRACVLAMKDVPAVNASIEGPNGGDTIVYRDYVDISVAVATEKGLVTPVVRNAESMDMVGIEKAIADLGKKARDNKLTIEDMAGGSFTISNVSSGYSCLGIIHVLMLRRVVCSDP